MRGLVDYLQVKNSRGKSKYGFINGEDGKMYWFSLDNLRFLKVGDSVDFIGGADEKGYIASQVSLIS